jgi:hypothetical protein
MRVIKRGRPRLTEEEVKSETVKMRMNKKQLEYAKRQADERGVKLGELFLLGLSMLVVYETLRDKK